MVVINPNVRTELIEIAINSTAATEFILGSLPNLREAKSIIKIEAYNNTQVTTTPTGKNVVNNDVFKKASLKLIDRNNVEFRHLTLSGLSKQTNGTTITPVNCPQIDPEKTKIVIGNVNGLVASEAFLLEITYEKPQQ